MRIALIAVLMGWALAGCGGAVTQQAAKTANPPEPTAPKSELKAAKIPLVVGDAKTLDAWIEKHKGEVVFVDYWATWCEPCVEFFPHTVELSQKYKDQGLATIAVSFDAPESSAAVSAFLTRHGADFENLLCSLGIGTAAFDDFKIDLVPHFRLYDRQGKVRYKWDAKPEDVEEKIQELLAEKMPEQAP